MGGKTGILFLEAVAQCDHSHHNNKTKKHEKLTVTVDTIINHCGIIFSLVWSPYKKSKYLKGPFNVFKSEITKDYNLLAERKTCLVCKNRLIGCNTPQTKTFPGALKSL